MSRQVLTRCGDRSRLRSRGRSGAEPQRRRVDVGSCRDPRVASVIDDDEPASTSSVASSARHAPRRRRREPRIDRHRYAVRYAVAASERRCSVRVFGGEVGVCVSASKSIGGRRVRGAVGCPPRSCQRAMEIGRDVGPDTPTIGFQGASPACSICGQRCDMRVRPSASSAFARWTPRQ